MPGSALQRSFTLGRKQADGSKHVSYPPGDKTAFFCFLLGVLSEVLPRLWHFLSKLFHVFLLEDKEVLVFFFS